ncbi:hypothetical protein [Paeniglutamicibacter quisquiliarum]|uniref:hypothetical protein n=1 Tax=Paeniglutamicibacter quisquiliarum TaxID=2849498 RepID=UPI0020C49A5B|nr:hypothetical protein [Paeniglutamicibacter quisquiliarum]
MTVAVVFVAVLALLAIFQLALACGAPWGRFAWGGQHPGILPTGYRIASAFSILVYGFIAVLALHRAGILDMFPEGLSRVGSWVVFGYLALGVVMNAISRSRPERYVMTPVALVLAVLALLIALSPAPERSFAGTVLDGGTGPVYCTTVMESFPPQCGADSPAVLGWDWSAVEHEQAQSVRWGEYSFQGVRGRDTITLVDVAAPLR